MAEADIKELRDLFAHDDAEWRPIRDEGKTDMRYVAGDPWEPKAREQREKAGRVILSLDELGQYVNQAINEVRANKRAVQFAPTGNGANDDTAKFYENLMRDIEYRSRAQIAYTTAFENCIQRSYGFVRVNRRYLHARSVNQDLFIDPVPNPDLVTPDSAALMSDLSDMKHCWIRESWTHKEHDRRWPNNKVAGRKGAREQANWITDSHVFVGEYWKIKTSKQTLLVVQPAPTKDDPQPDAIGVFEDEYDERQHGKVLEKREVDAPRVVQCLTNGVDILEEHEWPGKYIPIVGCFGKVLYVDDGDGAKRKILSLVRLAREPYMLYCYYRTAEAEIVSMTPKNPYLVYKGQLDATAQYAMEKANHEPVAFIEVNPFLPDLPSSTPLPLPQRQMYEPPIQALEIGAEAARRAIQAAMGLTPLPTAAQRRNEKSGVALARIEEQGQKGSYHFTDHFLDMITRVGIICEDLIPHVYDSARNVGVRKPNDTAEIVRINDPKSPKSISTKGDHLVSVSTGPSFESEREAASDFADTLVQARPETFAAIGDLVVDLRNLGPKGDEIRDRLRALAPPPVQAIIQSQDQQENPAMLAQRAAQAESQLKELQQLIEALVKEKETDAAKQQGQIQIAQMTSQADLQKAQMDSQAELQKVQMQGQMELEKARIDNAAKIRIAEIAAESKGMATMAEHAARHEEQATGIRAELIKGELEREHADHEAERDRQATQEAEQARMGHEANMAERAAQQSEAGA